MLDLAVTMRVTKTAIPITETVAKVAGVVADAMAGAHVSLGIRLRDLMFISRLLLQMLLVYALELKTPPRKQGCSDLAVAAWATFMVIMKVGPRS